jgi:hypothetical protein
MLGVRSGGKTGDGDEFLAVQRDDDRSGGTTQHGLDLTRDDRRQGERRDRAAIDLGK